MAATFELFEDVRFFENAREIVAVPAKYAAGYLNQHTFVTREIIEYKTLSDALASGKGLYCYHDAIKPFGLDA